jgi:carboxylate-amine ligase
MNSSTRDSFGFGLETEFLLVDARSFRPLWHPDLKFETLNAVLEAIPADDFQCDSFKVEPPHRKPGPYIVEGYHLTDPQMKPIDLLPKGVEIRTPVRSSIEDCLTALKALHGRLQHALANVGLQAVVLSFHPTEVHFLGRQNKRRYDHWQWAMAAMLTYGPDINVSLPDALARRIDVKDLNEKVNYYVPALIALTLASPLRGGKLWRIRRRIGKSVRTYHRSIVAPALEVHPEEGPRFELKPFEMTRSLVDYRNYFLLWLTLILDENLRGRASDETRIYDLGRIAWAGLEAETVRDRAGAVMEQAPKALSPWGFDCASLDSFRLRLELGHLPSDDIVSIFEREKTISGTLRHLVNLV